jgi:hypothetical protein
MLKCSWGRQRPRGASAEGSPGAVVGSPMLGQPIMVPVVGMVPGGRSDAWMQGAARQADRQKTDAISWAWPLAGA